MNRVRTPEEGGEASGDTRQTVEWERHAQEASDLFVRILARGGCSPEQIAEFVLESCRRIPSDWKAQAREAIAAMDAAAHALSVWFADPDYVDGRGLPRALPMRGDSSLESLCRRAAPELDSEAVLRHLVRPSEVLQTGDRYLPRDRVLWFRGAGSSQHSRTMRTLLAALGTLENNSQPEETTPGRYEVFAVNAHVPCSGVPAFQERLRRRADQWLVETDHDLMQVVADALPEEPRTCIGVDIFQFEEKGPACSVQPGEEPGIRTGLGTGLPRSSEK
jgi:Family of unknown function (DUF6502)